MAETTDMKHMSMRKQILLAHGDLLRLQLVLDCRKLQTACDWIDRAHGLARFVRPVLPWLAPTTALFASWKRRSWRGMLVNGGVAWGFTRLSRPLLLWFQGVHPGPKD